MIFPPYVTLDHRRIILALVKPTSDQNDPYAIAMYQQGRQNELRRFNKWRDKYLPYQVELEQVEDMGHWVNKNTKHYWSFRILNKGRKFRFYFEDPNEAINFKMRFG